AQAPAPFAELVVDRPYVLRFAGDESPSRTGAKRLGIVLEPLRRIALGIDRHRDEEEIAAHLLAELVLHLPQSHRGDRANVLAARIDEVDDDDLAFEEIVVKAHRLSILRDHRQVGEVAFPPMAALR